MKTEQKTIQKGGIKLPTGVKIISVVYYIVAGFFLLATTVTFVGSFFIESFILEEYGLPANTWFFWWETLIVATILFLLIAVIAFFIGRGLWKRKKWARIVAIIISGTFILFITIWFVFSRLIVYSSWIVNLPFKRGGNIIIKFVIHGLIGGYLLFNKKVKKAFV